MQSAWRAMSLPASWTSVILRSLGDGRTRTPHD